MDAILDLSLEFISESETEQEQDSPDSEDSKDNAVEFERKVIHVEPQTTLNNKIQQGIVMITEKILIADDQHINI